MAEQPAVIALTKAYVWGKRALEDKRLDCSSVLDKP
jgi:hypothetical protein